MWGSNFRRNQSQFQSLLGILDGIYIRNDSIDRWIWARTTGNEFSVASFYPSTCWAICPPSFGSFSLEFQWSTRVSIWLVSISWGHPHDG